MNGFVAAVFWVCVAAVFYTYVGYPWLLARWAWHRGASLPRPSVDGPLPSVSVLIAAYNESAVIGAKLRSLLASAGLPGEFEILVGDDASSDGTSAIVERLALEHACIRLHRFAGRTGKPGVMNELVRRARGDVLIFTDADVFFASDAVGRIAAWFVCPEVNLVAANVRGRDLASGGIARVEDAYVRREIQIKRRQSEVSGFVIAPFGACFAIRRSHYTPVPAGFAVDDFFVSLHAQLHGGRAVQAIDVLCYEDIASDGSEQFRRKVRISRGNFQNLAHFLPVVLRPWRPLGFHFVSHKVLRWLGPVWMAGSASAAAWLAGGSGWFRVVLVGMAGVAACGAVDRVASRLGLRLPRVRAVAHFVHMNLALGAGLLAWMSGRRGGVWNPTRRNPGGAGALRRGRTSAPAGHS